jgi:hypothetical protein
MDSQTSAELKHNIKTYGQVKENIKTLTEQKKLLEKFIIDTMNTYDLTTVELADGNVLNYQFKESISLGKEKGKKKGTKTKKSSSEDDD